MKLGLALSGGGIRGIAHAGAIKALEDNGIKIDVIGGTSSGALVSSLYALGYSPYYIYILFKRYAKEIAGINSTPIISGIRSFMINKKIEIKGLRSGKNIEETYNFPYNINVKLENLSNNDYINLFNKINKKNYLIMKDIKKI